MKFSAWQTSDRWKETREAHNWRTSKCLEDHSVSLCWLIVPTKSLTAADEMAPRCSICVAMEMERGR
jgi:hypothetical protein